MLPQLVRMIVQAESAMREKRKVPLEKVISTREIRGVIAQQLKAYYDLVEPISDRLAELLEQLAQRMNEREMAGIEKLLDRPFRLRALNLSALTD